MAVKRVSPEEAKKLMDEEGYVYVDVRSIPEFDTGHPAGAYNVPLLHMTPSGMDPNPDFLAVMEANFPKDAKLVIGCKAGGRSLKAAEQLIASGWMNVIDQRAGYSGAASPFGGLKEPGWSATNLPTATEPEPDHAYHALAAKAGLA